MKFNYRYHYSNININIIVISNRRKTAIPPSLVSRLFAGSPFFFLSFELPSSLLLSLVSPHRHKPFSSSSSPPSTHDGGDDDDKQQQQQQQQPLVVVTIIDNRTSAAPVPVLSVSFGASLSELLSRRCTSIPFLLVS